MPNRIEAGTLTKRVNILERSSGVDQKGNVDNTDAAIATVWASVSPIAGEESQRAGSTTATVTHEIRMRYRSDLPELTPKYRLALGSRTFTIVSARNPAEADVELVLQCTEVVT